MKEGTGTHAFEKPWVSEENEGIPRTLLASSGQEFFSLVQEDRAVMALPTYLVFVLRLTGLI